MSELRLYNSLSKNRESFKPIHPPKVGMYTCGPTVYDHVTIGNWRTYVLSDIVHRVLRYNGYDVKFIMNITDVGHLTGDNEGDSSSGEDRLEKGARREGKTAWQIADFYTHSFQEEYRKMNLLPPEVFAKATEHIQEQIDLVQKIEAEGLTYQTSDGIYFDTVLYEEKGYKYGELSNLEDIQEGARVEKNPEKKNPRDFALWKFSPTNEKRDMEWESPWGIGFPGWHIECSAMSRKYLGEQFDVHVGGEDLRETHHPNEIAQSQAVCDCAPFVRYWIHGAHLMVDGGRMGKSQGNAYTLSDIKEKELSPLALRYLYLTTHYKKQQNFTWEALEAAQHSLDNLYQSAKRLKSDDGEIISRYKDKFGDALNDDFSIAQAIAVMWEMLKDENESDENKYQTLLDFDEVLGLSIKEVCEKAHNIPGNVMRLVNEREEARKSGNWDKADKLREEVTSLGFSVEDTEDGPRVS